MKHCPKCGSTDISPPALYQPSIWKCLDCGYEGALIIEGKAFAEEKRAPPKKSQHDLLGGKKTPHE